MLMLLPTWTGFNVPHGFGPAGMSGLPPQFRLQSTPRFGPSLPTDTLTAAVAFTITEVICPDAVPLALVTEIAPSCGAVLEHPAKVRTAQHTHEKMKAFATAVRLGTNPRRLREIELQARKAARQSAQEFAVTRLRLLRNLRTPILWNLFIDFFLDVRVNHAFQKHKTLQARA